MKLTSRNWLILSTTVVILGLSGVYLDFFLSLNAYNINPEHFIKYEVNREIVDFFDKGIVPIFFFFSVVSLPFVVMFLLYVGYRRSNFRYIKEYLLSVFGLFYFLFFTRVFAGLTWYFPTLPIVELFQNISFIMMGVLACLFFLMHKEAHVDKAVAV